MSIAFQMNLSTMKTMMHAPAATTMRLCSKYARRRATHRPAAADATDDVEYSMAGTVIAASTAYGM